MIHSRKLECPFCAAKLNKAESKYLFHWTTRDVDRIPTEYAALYDILNDPTIQNYQEALRRKRENMVWKSLGDQVLKFKSEDYLLMAEHANRVLQEIDRIPQEDEQISEMQVPEVQAPARSNRLQVNRERETQQFTFRDSKPSAVHGTMTEYKFRKLRNEDMDYEADISIGDRPIAHLRRLCPHCLNILPYQLFEDPLVKVYLVAPMGCGKTSMLYSIYANRDELNRMNGSKMSIETIQDGRIDPYFEDFTAQAARFKAGEETKATETYYIPPVFFRVTLKETNQSLIAAFYDCAGELFNGKAEDNLDSAYTNAMRFSNMDAVWCLINSEFSAMYDDKGVLKLRDEQKKKIRGKGGLMPEEDRTEKESKLLAQDLCLEYLLKRDLGLQYGDMREQSEKTMETLQDRVGGQEQMTRAITDMYCAMIVTKCDYLEDSPMITAEDKEIFFRKSRAGRYFTPDYFDESEKEDRLDRHMIIRSWQHAEGLLHFDLNRFDALNYHCVAARIAEDIGELRPIRIEEPLVYMAEAFLRR